MRARLLLVVATMAFTVSCDQSKNGDAVPLLQEPRSGNGARDEGSEGDAKDLLDELNRELASKGEFRPHVVGGTEVKPGNIMAVVGLTLGSNRLPICTGTLIQPDIVLTAAHCICDRATGNIFIGDDARQSRDDQGYVGVQNWTSAVECNGHSGRDVETKVNLDLAILRIRRPVTAIEPMRFASAIDIDRASKAQVVGFGAKDRYGRIFEFKKEEAEVKVLSPACLDKDDAARYACDPGNEIVAGVRGGPDTCNGDSGGPLFVGSGGATPDSEREYMIAGVTSRPVEGASTPCGDGGVYERLTPFAQAWIYEAIKRVRQN